MGVLLKVRARFVNEPIRRPAGALRSSCIHLRIVSVRILIHKLWRTRARRKLARLAARCSRVHLAVWRHMSLGTSEGANYCEFGRTPAPAGAASFSQGRKP